MKVLGVIPARYGSSRFPGKPLIDLAGKSMIQRVYEGALKSKRFTEVIIATDDQRIVDEVHRFNGKVILTSSNHPSGTDRCGEVLNYFPEMDVVINIQGDEPLVDARQLDLLIDAFDLPHVQIATLGKHQVSEEDLINPNRIKIVTNHLNQALYFSRSPIPNSFHAAEEIKQQFPFLRHIGLYGYRAKVLAELIRLTPTDLEKIESLEQLRWLYYGYSIQVVHTDIETPNIDVPEDVEKVIQALLS